MSTDYLYVGEELELFSRAVRWKAYFASRIAPYLGGRVLEVGAGLGGTTGLLCDGSQEEWVCLEPDAGMAAQLKSRIASGDLPACCTVRVGTTEDLDAAGRFDTVVYIDVLEHLEDDAEEVRRAARLLRPGGFLVALSPAHPWLYSPFDRSIGHFRRYTRKSLAAIAPTTLERVKLVYLDSVGLFASLANRALLRQNMPTAAQVGTWDRFMVPVSRVVDPLLMHSVGKSVLAVWRKAPGEGAE